MNKVVTKILKHLVREAMKDPKVRRHAEEIAKAASEKAVDVAKVVYAGASEWLRQRQASAKKATGRSNSGKRAAPAKKPHGRKSAAKKTAGKKTAGRTKKPKRESPPQE